MALIQKSNIILKQSKPYIVCISKNVSYSRPRPQSDLKSIANNLLPKTSQMYNGLLQQNRASLAQAITLVESTLQESKKEAQKLMTLVTHHNSQNSRSTFRIGLTGPPGAGKSTFIETFGSLITEAGHRVAVLAVDPSSTRTGGSLLGDKTRMTELSRNPKAYIRPSPNRGHLGGVARTTNESINLCEISGYDVVLVETVGVGQSEHLVADMVDVLCLILPPAGGDELQGIKRGIIEQCDLVLINKSDGDLIPAANRTKAEYTSALKFIQPKSPHWRTHVMKMSSKNNLAIDEVWDKLLEYKTIMVESGEFETKRSLQQKVWMWHYIHNHLLEVFNNDSSVKSKRGHYERLVMNGELSPGTASDYLLKDFFQNNKTLTS